MEIIITNDSTNDFISNTNKDKISKDKTCQISPNLLVPKKNYKRYRKCTKSYQNFLTAKNIIFKSSFDHKGAKKFLAEKEKAMEELILEDEIIQEKQKNKNAPHICNKKNGSKNKNNTKKILNHYHSNNDIIHLKLHKHFHHHHHHHKKDHDKNKISTKTVSADFVNNIKEIGKVVQRSEQKKISLESIKSHLSNLKQKEPSYLFIGENDFFINTIVNQMSNIKN